MSRPRIFDKPLTATERQQRWRAKQKHPKTVIKKARSLLKQQGQTKRAARRTRIVEIAKNNVPLSTNQLYPVVYVDPPWEMNNYPTQFFSRAVPYPTLTDDELCALPVAAITTPDAILFIWTTAPKLPQCLCIITSWGFEYVTCMAWVKSRISCGWWVRNQHELLLIARKGNPPYPEPADRPPSVIHAPTRKHSQKPDEVYKIIEKMYPEFPKIELFARKARDGWDSWGNEI